MNVTAARINGKVTVGCPSPSSFVIYHLGSDVEWKTFQFHFHDFANLSTTKGHFVASPKFTCNGHQWQLRVCPGGYGEAAEGKVAVYLRHRSEKSITTRYGIKMIDKFGNATRTVITRKKEEFGAKRVRGSADYISRSVILDESQNILDSNGTLTFAVAIEEEPTTAFVPKNPLLKIMKGLCNDEATADVCFEVSAAQETDDDNGGTKRIKRTTPFYAHRLILDHCAPMLAAICGSNDSGGKVSVPVNDVKADVFRHLLPYVYGESIPKEDLKKYARDIIDAADKYSIVNLKLEAEAVYVQSVDICLDNVMDNLLYADSRNCALLKETVMNFLADNHSEASAHISFTDCPGHLMKDLLVAFGRNSKKDANGANADELTTLSVSELRRRLHERGLEVDGSREAMIESIKSNA
mmetsp:Transcript_11667/g.16728  ORF Transcript_11667/g.16728 Transcript_11667/m.16728 type:complete len:411 (-) Transcript_11667:649-1881(-)